MVRIVRFELTLYGFLNRFLCQLEYIRIGVSSRDLNPHTPHYTTAFNRPRLQSLLGYYIYSLWIPYLR